MLVLSRRTGEVICIDGDIQVVVCKLARGRVSLGVIAPEDVAIRRGELRDSISAQHWDENDLEPDCVEPT